MESPDPGSCSGIWCRGNVDDWDLLNWKIAVSQIRTQWLHFLSVAGHVSSVKVFVLLIMFVLGSVWHRVCVMGWVVVKILLTSSVTLPLSLSLSSRQHNPCMTLNSWLTAPPSRLFHPTTEQHGPSAPAPSLTVSPAECSVKTELLYHANYEKKPENFMFCFYCFFLYNNVVQNIRGSWDPREHANSRQKGPKSGIKSQPSNTTLPSTTQPCCLLFKHKFIKVIEAKVHTTHSLSPELHQSLLKITKRSRPKRCHFEMYYSSCKSFSWNCKTAQIFRATRGLNSPISKSQTSLPHLIYLPAPSSSLFQPHVEHTLRVMDLLRGNWFPTKLAPFLW